MKLFSIDLTQIFPENVLSFEERQRFGAISSKLFKQRSQCSRAALRCLLSQDLGLQPGDIEFSYGEFGKPWHPDIFFSVSHSGSTALIAVCFTGPVGVDLEHIRPIYRCLRIARRFFSPAEHEWLKKQVDIRCADGMICHPGLDPGSRLDPGSGAGVTLALSEAFLELWTAKEARLKLQGSSLFKHLQNPIDSSIEVRRIVSDNFVAHLAFQSTESTLENVLYAEPFVF